MDKRIVRFLLPINYFPAYHSNTLVTLMAQYRFRKQTRIRHGPYVLHSLVSLGSRTTDYRVIKFKKVVNCPGKSQLSERAVNYDNNPWKIGDSHDCIVSRRTPWNRADRVTVSTRGLNFLQALRDLGIPSCERKTTTVGSRALNQRLRFSISLSFSLLPERNGGSMTKR